MFFCFSAAMGTWFELRQHSHMTVYGTRWGGMGGVAQVDDSARGMGRQEYLLLMRPGISGPSKPGRGCEG
jgi:hypothetical protein